MSEVKEIKRSENKIQIVGEVSELNLKDEVKDTTIRKNGKEVKVKCGVIEKADYKSGASMTIKVAYLGVYYLYLQTLHLSM